MSGMDCLALRPDATGPLPREWQRYVLGRKQNVGGGTPTDVGHGGPTLQMKSRPATARTVASRLLSRRIGRQARTGTRRRTNFADS